ncbi:SIS domain-containing protein [Streptomyces sp. NPDC058371]|uniref:SIS domain-containing protein n=1 Tax=Streptomyces sp. NPDC058371 TaxID=3346463 RepID=UPI00365CC2FA
MPAAPEGTIPYSQGRAAQPAALERIVSRVAAQLDVTSRVLTARRPVFTGIGASHAALALPVRLLEEHGLPARRVLAGDLVPEAVFADADLVIGVSQSGRSTETLDALVQVAREHRAALVNAASSPLAESAAHRIDLGSEPDSYASTVGYTGTLIALTMIARALTGRQPAEITAEWAGIAGLLEEQERAIATTVDEFAVRAADTVAADLVASGAARSVTEAGALLLREVCRVPATALATRNYLHGAMESAGRTLHVTVGDGRELDLARTLAEAGHPTLALTGAPLTGAGLLHVAPIPGHLSPPVRTVLQTIVVQRLAGALAQARGVDIEDFVFHHADTKSEEPVG